MTGERESGGKAKLCGWLVCFKCDHTGLQFSLNIGNGSAPAFPARTRSAPSALKLVVSLLLGTHEYLLD
jgi:hypothetical protein